MKAQDAYTHVHVPLVGYATHAYTYTHIFYLLRMTWHIKVVDKLSTEQDIQNSRSTYCRLNNKLTQIKTLKSQLFFSQFVFEKKTKQNIQ